MKTILLAGGFGTRLFELTSTLPKPMIEVGGKPLLWHVMNCFAKHDLSDFLIALGYKGDVIKEYFLNCRNDWNVQLVDTGLHTQTGGRVKRLKEYVGKETFLMTYGDGIADIDFEELIHFHTGHGKLATVTAVRPPPRFGRLTFDGAQVVQFSEKEPSCEGWINGGFFVLEPEVFDYIENDETAWERGPLKKLVAEKELMAYFHEGFWQCMDTRDDHRRLESLWQLGKFPGTMNQQANR